MSKRNEAAFNKEMKRLEANIAMLQQKMKEHQKLAEKNNHKYWMAGDLQHWNELLEQVTNQED